MAKASPLHELFDTEILAEGHAGRAVAVFFASRCFADGRLKDRDECNLDSVQCLPQGRIKFVRAIRVSVDDPLEHHADRLALFEGAKARVSLGIAKSLVSTVEVDRWGAEVDVFPPTGPSGWILRPLEQFEVKVSMSPRFVGCIVRVAMVGLLETEEF